MAALKISGTNYRYHMMEFWYKQCRLKICQTDEVRTEKENNT
jgi:hypothetical protein